MLVGLSAKILHEDDYEQKRGMPYVMALWQQKNCVQSRRVTNSTL